MLFKNTEGVYVEICRSHYTNDTAYYNAIMNMKGYVNKCAKVNEIDRIKGLLSPPSLEKSIKNI
jgi:hypothetical protein